MFYKDCFDFATKRHRNAATVLVSQVLLHYQTVSEPATIRKLVSVLHKSSGEVLKKKPKFVPFFVVQLGRRSETK